MKLLDWVGRHKWITAAATIVLLLALMVGAAIVGAYVSAVWQRIKLDDANLQVLVQDYAARHPAPPPAPAGS